MGSSPDAHLIFGVDIGTGEGFGTLGPVADYALDVDWYHEWSEADGPMLDDEGQRLGYNGHLLMTLARRSGGPVKTVQDAAWHVEGTLGVMLVQWGDMTHWDMLPAILTSADGQFQLSTGADGTRPIDPSELATIERHAAARKIMTALELLGLTTTREPSWLLVADYG